MPTALILGISGQDGSLLARHLQRRGYAVHGTTRQPAESVPANFLKLGMVEPVIRHRLDLMDPASVEALLEAVAPDEIYHLAAPSSVGQSFVTPRDSMREIVGGTINVLEAMRMTKTRARLFFAASGECFGQVARDRAYVTDSLRPSSPYGAAKSASVQAINAWREAFDIWACSGFLFNHESPLRSELFVTQKIVRGALAVAAGETDTLHLGNLQAVRDWGWAEEYVDGMWRMLQQDVPQDLILATGVGYSVESLVAEVFSSLNMNWRDHVVSDRTLRRHGEAQSLVGDPEAAAAALGWRAEVTMPEVVHLLLAAAQKS